MKDSDCIEFLRWALPPLRMHWPGFRKVRGQVCKRIGRRLGELELADVAAYRTYLEREPHEWKALDGLCRVTVSRFYRDKGVFRFLEHEVLPELCRRALPGGRSTLGLWSAGCGSGEEPYTLALLWRLRLSEQFTGLGIRIVATDSDANMIRRGGEACYSQSSLKDLPAGWRDSAFAEVARLCLRPEYKNDVEFLCHDLREETPDGPFDLVLCRNLAFTYWETGLQLEVAGRIRDVLYPGGGLVIGAHETLPEGIGGFAVRSESHGVYQKSGERATS